MGQRPAFWTHDDKAAEHVGHLYYFAPTNRAPPPYTTQRHVEAIIDIASDGTLAGVELIEDMPPPPNFALSAPPAEEVEVVANEEEKLRALIIGASRTADGRYAVYHPRYGCVVDDLATTAEASRRLRSYRAQRLIEVIDSHRSTRTEQPNSDVTETVQVRKS